MYFYNGTGVDVKRSRKAEYEGEIFPVDFISLDLLTALMLCGNIDCILQTDDDAARD